MQRKIEVCVFGKGSKMAGGGWGCPHELEGKCSKINNLPCDPGMKGCQLYSRYVFFDGSKNERLLEKQARVTTNPSRSNDSPDENSR